MTYRALPIEVTNILERLEFISRIPGNYKVNIPDKTLQHKDSWWGAFARGRKNVDRKSTLRDIQTLIDDTSQVLKTFSHDDEYTRLIINALRKAKQPIQDMGESTYGDDVSVASEITVKIKIINIYLEKYKKYLDPSPHINNNHRKYKKISKPSNNNYKDVIADLNLSDNDELVSSDDI